MLLNLGRPWFLQSPVLFFNIDGTPKNQRCHHETFDFLSSQTTTVVFHWRSKSQFQSQSYNFYTATAPTVFVSVPESNDKPIIKDLLVPWAPGNTLLHNQLGMNMSYKTMPTPLRSLLRSSLLPLVASTTGEPDGHIVYSFFSRGLLKQLSLGFNSSVSSLSRLQFLCCTERLFPDVGVYIVNRARCSLVISSLIGP